MENELYNAQNRQLTDAKRMRYFGTDAVGCTQHVDMAGLPSRL